MAKENFPAMGSATIKRWRALLWLVAWSLLCGCRGEELSSDLHLMDRPTSCSYHRAYGMYGAHCGGLKLSSLSSNLRTSIEILDFSDNRIRELTDDTFKSFTSIKYLYLEGNIIYNVEENALTPLTYMEILDLSQNAITTIPNSILFLPSLRKLALKGNPLIHWDVTLQSLQKPIGAPLEILDISDCKLRRLPDLGILPELKEYNVSDNLLVELKPESFAGTCKLRKLDLSRSVDKIKPCALKPAVDYLSNNNVYFILEDYSKLSNNEFYQCPDFTADHELNSTQQQCLSATTSGPVYRSTQSKWVTVVGGLSGFVVGFMLLLYVMHRRNVAQTKKTRKGHPEKEDALINNAAEWNDSEK